MFDLNYLGLGYEDARMVRGVLGIMETYAEEMRKSENPIRILAHLQDATDLTTEYRKNDSYKTEQMKEVLRHLKDEYKVPYSKLEATFIQRNVIIADMQMIR